MGYLIGFIVVLPLAVVSAMWRGYALSILWTWFVVPVFAVPQIGMAQAFGLCLVVGMFKSETHCDDSRDSLEKLGSAVGMAAAGPLLTICVGWILKGFL